MRTWRLHAINLLCFLIKSKSWGDKIGFYPVFRVLVRNSWGMCSGKCGVTMKWTLTKFLQHFSGSDLQLCQQNEMNELQDLRCLTVHVPFLRLFPSWVVFVLRNKYYSKGKNWESKPEIPYALPCPTVGPWQTLQSALQQHFQKYSEIWVTDLKLLNHGRFSVWFLVALNRDPHSDIYRERDFKCFEPRNKLDIGLKISLSISKTLHRNVKTIIFQYQ